MSDIIHLLPDVIANQIAAGEVVQRPASVVKEMLENSIDAGSSRIILHIEDAGKKHILISDDGCGMSQTDARMALERHATSKIKELDDLYRIRTLGFRGEALASIAAVSQLTIKTRKKGDEAGTVVVCEGGNVARQEAESCKEGTSISVKNLFYNVPARRNFLKSNNAEWKHILDAFISVALAHPRIAFELSDNNKKVYHLPAQNMRKRISSIFKQHDSALVPVEEKTSLVSINGFIGTHQIARKKRGEQFFFINKRYIRDNYLNHAVASAFENLLPNGYHPFYVLFLEMDPAHVDINVHPTKTEVKFEDQKAVYAFLKSAVRKTLNRSHIAPSIDFDKDKQWEQYFSGNAKSDNSQIGLNSPVIPGNAKTTFRSGQTEKDWESFYKVLSVESDPGQEGTDSETQKEQETVKNKDFLRLQDKYIISTLRSGFLVVHRYKALERILYEEYLQNLDNKKRGSQQQLFPEVLNLNPADSKLFEKIVPALELLGFALEPFGKNAWMINGIPADALVDDVKEFMDEMLEQYKHHQNASSIGGYEKIARSLSVTAARRQKKSPGNEEMAVLIDRLFGCKEPYFTPDGSPTFITIALDELDKKFKKS